VRRIFRGLNNARLLRAERGGWPPDRLIVDAAVRRSAVRVGGARLPQHVRDRISRPPHSDRCPGLAHGRAPSAAPRRGAARHRRVAGSAVRAASTTRPLRSTTTRDASWPSPPSGSSCEIPPPSAPKARLANPSAGTSTLVPAIVPDGRLRRDRAGRRRKSSTPPLRPIRANSAGRSGASMATNGGPRAGAPIDPTVGLDVSQLPPSAHSSWRRSSAGR